MTLRMVQAGRGEVRDLVVLYYYDGRLDRAVREACPRAVILNDTRPVKQTANYRRVGTGGVLGLEKTRQRAIELSGALAIGRTVIAGFSAGCQAVRSLLLEGAEPDAVVTADGTHASLPALDWQIKVWRDLAAAARRAERVWFASHTMLTYVEELKPPAGPYMSTRQVLARATGWELGPDDAQRFEGLLHVWSYAGATAAAHRHQAREALPEMLSAALDALLPDTAPDGAPDTLRGGQARGGLAAAALARALADLETGVKEEPAGSNDGPEVGRYLRAVGVPPPAAWCAAGTTAWVRDAAELLGVDCPVGGSAGAQALGAQFRAAGRWVDRAEAVPALHLLPGQVVVWRRGPPGDWRGHVGLLERVEGQTLHTVEPNSGPRGDRVARMRRDAGDGRLLGFGLLTTPEELRGLEAAVHGPTILELEDAARLMELGAECMRGEDVDPLAELLDRLEGD